MRTTKRLSVPGIARLTEPGYYSDGGNLFLQVSKGGTKSWLFRYGKDGKKREMGLGSLQLVTLAGARERALQARVSVLDGVDPIAQRADAKTAARVELTQRLTFKQCAEKVIEAQREGWKNAKHEQQWTNTLATYAFPTLGDLPPRAVTLALVEKCLAPIWFAKPETARRVRQRIESVMAWAKAHEACEGDNPADKVKIIIKLGSQPKVKEKKHHAAIEIDKAPGFLADIRTRPSASAHALEFLMLTAARTSEVTGAQWAEIDITGAVWTVPAERMKAGVTHRVPLSEPAVAMLTRAKQAATSPTWIFPGAKKGRPLSNMAMLELVRGMGTLDADGDAVTVHGFRSTFRDWAAERTTDGASVAEYALAHGLPDATEAAYQRSKLFDKRAALMSAWAKFLCA